jgi:alpha-galactosidase
VTANPEGPVVLKTPTAEFDVLPSGYVKAYLLKDGKRLTLDAPGPESTTSGDHVICAGTVVGNFALDLAHVMVSDTKGKLGARGKRVEIIGRSSGERCGDLEKTMAIEVYDDFPNLALTTVAYKNSGMKPLQLDRVVAQQHRLDASLADPKVPPYRLWSFQGSSYEPKKDADFEISRNFSQPNLMGVADREGEGGGIPVVAFWTAVVGEAIGHVETLPLVLSLPVKVASDGRIDASLVLEPKTTLKPGEVYSTPRSFVAVYSGDFYEPLRLYSSVLQREGWTIPKPTNADYDISWCSWGYLWDVTPARMLGIIPKLKQLNINWACLDDGWFDRYGDWEPRPDRFPGDAIKKMVDEFHKQGILVQIWWLPLSVNDGQAEEQWMEPFMGPLKVAEVIRQHPDWLILDKHGRHARMAMGLAALCPALPEVQEYHKKLTEKFIRDWGYDGHKLDVVYTVPACYNPKHRHKSPNDSINAMAQVYKVIFETTRRLKPESVTQICPCGTTPNFAWLPYMDQAVTGDPLGGGQMRRRIKMYKALLGPQAAAYGDHVELSEIVHKNSNLPFQPSNLEPYTGKGLVAVGRDFASTIGVGGVVGTKFTWPDYLPGYREKAHYLTSEKEAHWKKWIDIYNAKMLSRGTFLNLYILGYDIPEGYAIEKEGKMYYAFFAPPPSATWRGEIELRGLLPGRYRVLDYVNGRDLGTVESPGSKLATKFSHHLLLEVSRM